ncbi:MAG: bestrophin family ion channel [Siphonobacter sp.]
MHSGKQYRFSEFIVWTRRNIYFSIVLGNIAVVLYQIFGLKWLGIPWSVVALVGTATAFIVGFKNTQTYNRTWEARQIWGGILNKSRAWGIIARDYIDDSNFTKELIYRHFAWLTALRYQMRDSRAWETADKAYNTEYKAFYTIPEKETSLESELSKYVSEEELKYILSTKNRAAQILSLQSKTIKQLYKANKVDTHRFIGMENIISEFYDLQGKSERIKNFPYPRQFASINTFFIKLFICMLPFGMLKEFDKLNDSVEGIMKGNMIWLVIPFSVLISWIYTSLEQVGESTENPFEGSANDVPISQMSRTIEIDMREMLGETSLPPALQPINNIIL